MKWLANELLSFAHVRCDERGSIHDTKEIDDDSEKDTSAAALDIALATEPPKEPLT